MSPSSFSSYSKAERPKAPPDPLTECVLYKIPGYTCKVSDNNLVCKSFNRLFKHCPGQPRVEMVLENGTFVDIQHHRSIGPWHQPAKG